MENHKLDMVEYRLNQLMALGVISAKEYDLVYPDMDDYKEPWYAGTLIYKQNPYTEIDSFILKKLGRVK